MSVIPVTVFFSLLLAGLFAALFAREQRRRRFASPERDSLLPLAEETPRLLEHIGDGPLHAAGTEDAHAHACGCRDGSRPPCPGCQKHRLRDYPKVQCNDDGENDKVVCAP